MVATTEFNYEIPTKKERLIQCSCGNEIIQLVKWSDEKEVSLIVYSYLSDRYNFFERLCILFGGKVRTCDVVLSKEEFDKIKKFKG
jgi:hypothetical protein